MGLNAGTLVLDTGLQGFLYLGFGNTNEALPGSILFDSDINLWRVFGFFLPNDICGILIEYLVELDKLVALLVFCKMGHTMAAGVLAGIQ